MLFKLKTVYNSILLRFQFIWTDGHILFQLFVNAFVCRPSTDLNNHIPHADMTHWACILPALCRLHKHRPPQAYITQPANCAFASTVCLKPRQTHRRRRSVYSYPCVAGRFVWVRQWVVICPNMPLFCGLKIWPNLPNKKSTSLCSSQVTLQVTCIA